MDKESDYKFYVPDYLKDEPLQGVDPLLLNNLYLNETPQDVFEPSND